ncbi:aquaporin [candidate division KSB1 bacterium]|nr:aquaporin [candidate division KSB1 bacterium]
MEAAELGIFMIVACLLAAVIDYSASPVRQMIPNDFVRRSIFGVAMGLTAIAMVYSPMGKQSGAHFNPAVTLTFLRLGKVAPWDAVCYIIAQFVGGVSGVMLSAIVLGEIIAHPTVNYVATIPGKDGVFIAFVAEIAITFILMSVVLMVSNTERIAKYTGVFAGALVAMFITFEAPFSGMSMNPARTLASALPGQIWNALWVYFTAPVLGMLLASSVYLSLKGRKRVACAKLHHQNKKRCIFCEYQQRGG